MPERGRRDPICGKELPRDATTLSRVFAGETWSFCSRLCEIVFEAFPERSVEIARQEVAALLEIEHPPPQMQHEHRMHGPDPPGDLTDPDGTTDAIDRTGSEDFLRNMGRETTR